MLFTMNLQLPAHQTAVGSTKNGHRQLYTQVKSEKINA